MLFRGQVEGAQGFAGPSLQTLRCFDSVSKVKGVGGERGNGRRVGAAYLPAVRKEYDGDTLERVWQSLFTVYNQRLRKLGDNDFTLVWNIPA